MRVVNLQIAQRCPAPGAVPSYVVAGLVPVHADAAAQTSALMHNPARPSGGEGARAGLGKASRIRDESEYNSSPKFRYLAAKISRERNMAHERSRPNTRLMSRSVIFRLAFAAIGTALIAGAALAQLKTLSIATG